MWLSTVVKTIMYCFGCQNYYLILQITNIIHIAWQRNGNKKSDSVCFADNSNNIDTLC